MNSLAKGLIYGIGRSVFNTSINKTSRVCVASIHQNNWSKDSGPKNWLNYNDKVVPPISNDSKRPPAWVCHMRTNIKYSPSKMWYVVSLIRGMSVDEAKKQLSFTNKKAAHIIKEVIEEAQEIAVRDHNVEYKSNLWIAESFHGKAQYVRGLRKHARGVYCKMEYKYCHYFLRLEEGPPPKHYYEPEPTNQEKLSNFISDLRNRTVYHGL